MRTAKFSRSEGRSEKKRKTVPPIVSLIRVNLSSHTANRARARENVLKIDKQVRISSRDDIKEWTATERATTAKKIDWADVSKTEANKESERSEAKSKKRKERKGGEEEGRMEDEVEGRRGKAQSRC